MSPPARRPDLEALLADARWVRALARGLVRDPWTADDVVQDAWVAALSRPMSARCPRAWLAGVVRHLALRDARATGRRRRREGAAPPPPDVPSADELFERTELQERLSAAVRALDEPYRTTVLLRFAEGLPLERIAASQGVPASTVRTRLARALEHLRARLDREHGDRATWVSALAPLAGTGATRAGAGARSLPPAPTTTPSALGSLAMGAKTGLAIAAAAGVATLTLAIALRAPRAGEPPRAPSAVDARLAALAGSPEAAPPPLPAPGAADRVPLLASHEPEDTALVAEAPQQHVVWGYLTGKGGDPVDGSAARVRFVDEHGQMRYASPGGNGVYSILGLDAGRWTVNAWARGYWMKEQTIHLPPEPTRQRLDFHLWRQVSVNVVLVAPGGRPFLEAAREIGLETAGLEMVVVARREPPGERVVGRRNHRYGVGSMWFEGQTNGSLPPGYWGRIDLIEEPPVEVSVMLYQDVLQTRRVEEGQEDVTFTLDPATIPARLGGIEVTVVDGLTADPVVDASVRANPPGGWSRPVRTDGSGHARLAGLPSGLYDLRISAAGRASIWRQIEVPRERVLDLGVLAMQEPRPVRGRAIDADGNGVEVEVRSCALPEPWGVPNFGNAYVSSAADGTFTLDTLEAGRWLLHVEDQQVGRIQGNAAELMAENVVVDTRAGPVEDLLVRLAPVSHAVVHWMGAEREGLRMRFFDGDGRMRQTGSFPMSGPARVALPPGAWRLVVVDEEGATLAERHFALGAEPAVLDLAPDR